MSTTFDRHEKCLAALPAFVGGKLSASEAAAVVAHAKTCAECSEELEFARRLHTHFGRTGRPVVSLSDGDREQASFDQLWARIVADSPAPVRLVPKRSRWGWASTLTAMAATVLFGVSASYHWYGTADEPQFQTLSESMRSCQALHVRITPQTDAARAREMFESVGARVVEGPDAAGAYTLTAPNVANVLSKVRELPVVQSVETKPC
jgi:anti-sigma factor RsiW